MDHSTHEIQLIEESEAITKNPEKVFKIQTVISD